MFAGRLLGDANDAFASGPPAPEAPRGAPRAAKILSPAVKMVKILPPAVKMVKKWSKFGLPTVKYGPPAVKYSQNFASGGKKRSYYFEKCGRRGLPEKMHQGPPDSKAAPGEGACSPPPRTYPTHAPDHGQIAKSLKLFLIYVCNRGGLL